MGSMIETLPLDPQQYRGDFPILNHDIRPGIPLIYLDNAATTQRPRQVIDTLVEMYERHYANVHRGIHWLSDQSTDRYENAREKVRDFIHAESIQEIIFTTGTTFAINLVARSWGGVHLKPGDEVLLSEMEHHSNLVPWQQVAESYRLHTSTCCDHGRRPLGLGFFSITSYGKDQTGGNHGGFQRFGNYQSYRRIDPASARGGRVDAGRRGAERAARQN